MLHAGYKINEIRVPKRVSVFYCKKKQLLVCKSGQQVTSFKTKLQIILKKNERTIEVTSVLFFKISNSKKKSLAALHGTAVAKLKHMFVSISLLFYQPLKFVGVGYRAITINKLEGCSSYFLRLGLSHRLYLNAGKHCVKMMCLKYTKLFVFGAAYTDVMQVTASLRSQKTPEPYKGKGIRRSGEVLKLKKGKRV